MTPKFDRSNPVMSAGLIRIGEVARRITAPAPAPHVDIPRHIVRIARAEFAKGVREVPMGSNNSAEIARYRSARGRQG